MVATIPALPPNFPTLTTDLPALQKIAAQCRISLQLLLWPILGIVHTNPGVVTRRSIFSLRVAAGARPESRHWPGGHWRQSGPSAIARWRLSRGTPPLFRHFFCRDGMLRATLSGRHR